MVTLTFNDNIPLFPGCDGYGPDCETCTIFTCTRCADGTYFDAGTNECEGKFYIKCI